MNVTLDTDILTELTDDDILFLFDNYYDIIKDNNYFLNRMRDIQRLIKSK